MSRDEIEIPPSGLVTAELAAQIVGVSVSAIRVWKNRGHLDVARDTDGVPFRDDRGRQVFDYMDVINTEFKTRKAARRNPVSYAA